ncbi:hypothetical protein ATM97_04535 [Nocardia sp. MH4]|jgi:hypothetical protein|uniref:hypothetical protein n=1 Tax=Nocardia TaxID=1817 RepID=UPI001C4F1FD8|nr:MULTISPECIES: hypothetical protein [Nocardia]MBW0270348.1 hypothetical protein [Nocardia sp. MH4]
MKRWIATALFELGLAVICLAGAVYSWRHARRVTGFVTSDEHPGFEAVRYVPPLLLLASALVIVAGLLVIDAVARIATRSVALRSVEPMS